MGDLVDQPGQRLGVADRTVGDPLLVADQALADRLEIGLRLRLVVLQIGDPGVRRDQVGGERRPLGLEPGELGVLGQRAAAVLQLRDRAVDGLQVQQPELDRRVSLDVVPLNGSFSRGPDQPPRVRSPPY
jgi:hypothetical protein